MTITTPRSRNRFTSVCTIVALLAAFGMFGAAHARAAGPPERNVEAIDFNAALAIADEGNMRFGPARVDLAGRQPRDDLRRGHGDGQGRRGDH